MHRPNCADTKHRGGRKQCNSGRFMASAGGVPTGSRADFGHCQGSPSRNRSPLTFKECGVARNRLNGYSAYYVYAYSIRWLEAFTTDAKIIRLTRRRVAFFPRRRRRGIFSTAIATRVIFKISRVWKPGDSPWVLTSDFVGATEEGGIRHWRLSCVVVSALGIRAWCPGFESRLVPLFHWVATLGKLFTHIASPVSHHLQETGVHEFFVFEVIYSHHPVDCRSISPDFLIFQRWWSQELYFDSRLGDVNKLISHLQT